MTQISGRKSIILASPKKTRTVLFFRCRRCGRDFAQGLNGAGWHAAYIGLLKVELLADDVTQRWLSTECPGHILIEANVDRGLRRS